MALAQSRRLELIDLSHTTLAVTVSGAALGALGACPALCTLRLVRCASSATLHAALRGLAASTTLQHLELEAADPPAATAAAAAAAAARLNADAVSVPFFPALRTLRLKCVDSQWIWLSALSLLVPIASNCWTSGRLSSETALASAAADDGEELREIIRSQLRALHKLGRKNQRAAAGAAQDEQIDVYWAYLKCLFILYLIALLNLAIHWLGE
jgi:hypothetical protein